MKKCIEIFCAFVFLAFSQSAFSAEKPESDLTVNQNTTESPEGDAQMETEQKNIINFVEKDAEENIEKVKVTGSRIKRINLEGPNPVTIFTKEDLDNSGYLSVSEFLENTSLSNFGDPLIHDRSTLTLVNGKRLVYDGVVDLIPTSAIERIEILRDGASALYGSDVVGGVINIITKKAISSPEISLKAAPSLYPFYKGGSQAEASAVYGKAFDKGHFVSTLQFQYNEGIKARDRKKWINDTFLNTSPYPSFRTKNGAIVDPKCPEDLQVKQGSDIVACKHNFIPYAYISQNTTYFSSYNYAEYKWMNEISLYTQWFGFWQGSTKMDQPIIDSKRGLSLPNEHKMSMGSGSEGTLLYIFDDVYRDESSNNIFLDGLVGAKGYISKTWDFDLSLKWSNIWTNNIYANHPYKADLEKIIVSGLYDPFDPSKRDFSSVRLHDSVYKDNDTRFFTSLDFSGETGFWGIDMAVGAQAYYNKYRNHADPKVIKGEIYALAAAETKDLPSRTLVAAYVEGIKNFSDVLEIQAAGRLDRYSDFGWTANPKLAVRFQPFSQFFVRSSVGSSFEAPALSDLYTPETTGYITIYDELACYNELRDNKHFDPIYNSNIGEGFESKESKDKLIKDFLIEQSDVVENKKLSKAGKTAFKSLANKLGDQNYCRFQSFPGTFKGNKNLKETKALTASLGFHWEVSEDHSLTVDYWWNSLSGTPIDSLHGNKKAIDAELKYGKKYVEKQGVQYERDNTQAYNPIKNPVSSLINIGGKQLSGVDVRWESDFSNWNLASGNFYFKDEFSNVIKAGVETFPGMGYVNNLGKFGLPKWRNFATFGWQSPKHNISLLLKSVAGVKKTYNEFETLPMSHILDMFYQYNMDMKTSFKLGWYNLLFSDPVIDDSRKQGLKFDRSFFDIIGPHFFVEMRRVL